MNKYFLFFISLFVFPVFVYGETFYRSLSLGMSGNDVMFLQKILNQDLSTVVSEDGPGSLGQETMYFGEKTKNAVIRFQEKYKNEILMPLGLSYGTGFVGNATLAKLNSLGENQTVSTGTSYEIANVSGVLPEISFGTTTVNIKEGEKMVILGKNFGEDSQIKISSDSGEVVLNSVFVSSNQLEFVFSTPFTQGIKETLKELEDFDFSDDLFKSMQDSLGGSGKYIEIPFSLNVISNGKASLPIKVMLIIEK